MANTAFIKSLLEMDLADSSGENRLDNRGFAVLEISQTPVRKAVNRLAREGSLKIIPRKGVYYNQKIQVGS